MRPRAAARAPGKVMLAGEYAVLEGAPAVVMAVDRYAEAVADQQDALSDQHGWLTPELDATLRRARREGLVDAMISARVRPASLFDGDRKLGLGSSAAMCVAGLFAALRASGGDDSDEQTRARATEIALEGHREAQGGGSGMDVYASAIGGVFCTAIAGGRATTIERLSWPKRSAWRVLWTGEPVSTKAFVARVKELASSAPSEHRALIARVREASEAFVRALRDDDATALVAVVRAHGDAMDALGARAGIPIVTDVMRSLSARAAALGCAIKPSGAGGGDIVLAVSDDEPSMFALVSECAALGVSALELSVDSLGARCERDDHPLRR